MPRDASPQARSRKACSSARSRPGRAARSRGPRPPPGTGPRLWAASACRPGETRASRRSARTPRTGKDPRRAGRPGPAGAVRPRPSRVRERPRQRRCRARGRPGRLRVRLRFRLRLPERPGPRRTLRKRRRRWARPAQVPAPLRGPASALVWNKHQRAQQQVVVEAEHQIELGGLKYSGTRTSRKRPAVSHGSPTAASGPTCSGSDDQIAPSSAGTRRRRWRGRSGP